MIKYDMKHVIIIELLGNGYTIALRLIFNDF